MWGNWSPVGFLTTPEVVSVYVGAYGMCVRESEVESKTAVRESQRMWRRKRESVITHKTRDRFCFWVRKIYRRLCLKLMPQRWQHAPLLCLHAHWWATKQIHTSNQKLKNTVHLFYSEKCQPKSQTVKMKKKKYLWKKCACMSAKSHENTKENRLVEPQPGRPTTQAACNSKINHSTMSWDITTCSIHSPPVRWELTLSSAPPQPIALWGPGKGVWGVSGEM